MISIIILMARLRYRPQESVEGGERALIVEHIQAFLCGPNFSARYLGTIDIYEGLEWTLVTCGVVLDGFVLRFGPASAG